MKKNKFLRLASVMLMLCLITTCAISGTFAKYTTSGTATDTARVAAWGVTVSVTGQFVKEVGTTVKSTTDDVVAPGMSGTIATVTASGTPEVSCKIVYSATFDFGANWTETFDNDNDGGTTPEVEYCPLVITVGTSTYAIDGIKLEDGSDPDVKCDDLADLKAKVEAAVADYTTDTFNAGTSISSTLTLSYAWAFDDNDDELDTALGDQANKPTIEVTVNATVEQTNA
ncbi:MAG: hypothetical protein IJV68_07640 [Clostridia bacterium]|nr:hypothetical protein [Clostridia bacterium]